MRLAEPGAETTHQSAPLSEEVSGKSSAGARQPPAVAVVRVRQEPPPRVPQRAASQVLCIGAERPVGGRPLRAMCEANPRRRKRLAAATGHTQLRPGLPASHEHPRRRRSPKACGPALLGGMPISHMHQPVTRRRATATTKWPRAWSPIGTHHHPTVVVSRGQCWPPLVRYLSTAGGRHDFLRLNHPALVWGWGSLE